MPDFEKNKQENDQFYFVRSYDLEDSNMTYFEHQYVDICDGDLVAGILLAKIIYWFSPCTKLGSIRTQDTRNGKTCLIRRASDWWLECRLTKKRYMRAIDLLKQKEFVETEIHFNPSGKKITEHSTFIFLNKENIMTALKKINKAYHSLSFRKSNYGPPKKT